MLVRLPSRAASGRQGSREVPTTIPDPRELLKASSVPHPGGPPPTQHPLWPGPARWSIPTGKSMGGRGRLCGKAPPTPPTPAPAAHSRILISAPISQGSPRNSAHLGGQVWGNLELWPQDY